MVPSSGSATSFAGALQQGGALARYSASAAAALAAGTPTNALPTQSLSIQLRPVELGSVTAHLKYAGSGLSIDIEVETPEAHRRLSNDSSDIVKSLQSLGFQVDKVTVRQALAQSQTQSQGQQQGQAQGQAMGRDGSASQGGSPFSMSGQSGGNGHRQGSESRYENASERGIGMVRETADRVSRRGVFI
jgi:chemotaxis protein MotD